jgi:hypothetical protein
VRLPCCVCPRALLARYRLAHPSAIDELRAADQARKKKKRIVAPKKIRIVALHVLRIGGACGPPPPFVAPLVPSCAHTYGATPPDELAAALSELTR